ncbi:MAG: hypothetical protein IBX71_00690 [Candidatus Desulforudis sp.]|nr:hypothetical protein [Desulforudis sp.]
MLCPTATGAPFVIRDCTLIAIATGKRAQNLRELRDNLLIIHPGSIYYHFWGGLLRSRFDNPEYNNDFAAWANHGLRDKILAERLGVINPADFCNLEFLRRELIEVIEERLDESELVPWSKTDQQFQFIRAQIIVFNTHWRIRDPEELAAVVPKLSVGSVFFHFIDARRCHPDGLDHFRAWLTGCGERYTDLIDQLAAVDPYFVTLSELRQQLAIVFSQYFGREN